MNTKLFFSSLALALAIFSLSSCGLAEKDLTFVIEKEIALKDTGKVFIGSDVIDALSASNDFKDRKNHIKSSSIEKVTYYLTYFNGSSTQSLVNGSVSISEVNNQGATELASLSNINLMNATKEAELKTNSAGLEQAKKLLLNDPFKAKLTWNATVNEAPVDIKLKTRFHVKVTVGL